MNFINNKNKNLLFDFTLIIISTIPYWLLYDLESIDRVLAFILFSYFVFFFVAFYFLNLINNRQIIYLFTALIIFYGFDNKIGLWSYFLTVFDEGVAKYIISLIFCLFVIIIIYQSLKNNFLITKTICLNIIVLITIFNIILNYHYDNKYKILENFKEREISKNIQSKPKTLIIFLDEMLGYNGINKNIKFGLEAKNSYLKLFEKYKLTLYTSAYSIYHTSNQSISSTLNFDFNTEKDNTSNYFKENTLDSHTTWYLKKNRFFEANKDKKIISNKNHGISYCSKNIQTCYRSKAINNFGNYINSFNFNAYNYFMQQMSNQNSILSKYFFKFLRKFNIYNNYHFLTFNKVKFENDLQRLSGLVKQSDADIFLFHFLFPHRPFVFEIDNENKCIFDKKKLKITNSKNLKIVLTQHNKEIICTTIYLDKFLNSIYKVIERKDLNIIIMSDHGINSGNKSNPNELKNFNSVLFASNIRNKHTKIDNTFISSQELFYNLLNNKNIYNSPNRKIFDFENKKYIPINENQFYNQ